MNNPVQEWSGTVELQAQRKRKNKGRTRMEDNGRSGKPSALSHRDVKRGSEVLRVNIERIDRNAGSSNFTGEQTVFGNE